ncbi:MAG: hypothetical protein ACXW4B_10680 [Micavibrio sp.]
MEEIEKRLRDVSDACVKAYLEWHNAKKDAESRETLQDAIHEMRKVAARLEIEIAVSERDEMAMRPIPIPPHRATRKRQGEDDDNGDNAGNFNNDGGGNHQGGGERGPAPRHVLRRRSQHQGGGGGGHQGGGNRPKGEE